MKVYKVVLVVVDHDELGKHSIVEEIENVRYPNHCLSPDVFSIDCRDIGEWSDDHPLNFKNKFKAEFAKLFADAHNEAR